MRSYYKMLQNSRVTMHDVTPFLFFKKTKVRINELKQAYDIQAFNDELNK